MELLERYRGSLLGLAVGDALGQPLEFKRPGSFVPIKDMVGGGTFKLPAGYWTDDTAMALCLAESLVECNGFNPINQLKKYLKWYQEGYLSSTGNCFDIGNTVRAALLNFQRTGQPYCGPTDPLTAGNGSIMRLSPVPMFYRNNPQEAMAKSAESSRTTHQAETAIDACRYLAALLVGALNGVAKEELLIEQYEPFPGCWREKPLVKEIDQIALGSFKHREPPDIKRVRLCRGIVGGGSLGLSPHKNLPRRMSAGGKSW